jgi:hypothetical protein
MTRFFVLASCFLCLACATTTTAVVESEYEPVPRAPSQRGPCNGLAQCTAGCDAGDRMSCRRLFAFGPSDDAQRLPLIQPTLERACNGAVPRACLPLGWWACDDESQPAGFCDARAHEYFLRACAAGEGLACMELESNPGNSSPQEIEAWRARGEQILQSECAAGDYLGCINGDMPIMAGTPESERVRAMIMSACETGNDSIACFVYAEALEEAGDAQASVWTRKGCAITTEHFACERGFEETGY